jgi:hypothetical protein
MVNPFLPLFNYKRQIETGTKIDLYGKKISFKYSSQPTESFKI